MPSTYNRNEKVDIKKQKGNIMNNCMSINMTIKIKWTNYF